MDHFEIETVEINKLSKKAAHSIQVYQYLGALNSFTVAELYFDWLGKFFNPFIFVETSPGLKIVTIRFLFFVLLKLEKLNSFEPESETRFQVVGGILPRVFKGQQTLFNFISEPPHFRVELRRFFSRFPFFIYRITQGPLHRWVMKRFGIFLSRRQSKTGLLT